MDFDDLPADVRTVARHCLLDWVGVTVAGAQDDATRILRETLLIDESAPVATLVGSSEKTSLRNAAEINGTAAHAIDFDDLHVPAHLPDGAIGHPSAPVLGALLPLTETQKASGRDLLAAFVAGIETECRIGLMVAPGHYETGWHSTATIGTFGAAAASAHLLGLNISEWQHTLGLASMQAQGLKAMFGSMCKPFQVGKASSNGLQSALLAQKGYTSNPQALGASQGFRDVMSTTHRDLLPSGYEILKTRFKKFACCGGTHPTIEGVQSLMKEVSLHQNDINSVTIEVHPSRDAACNIPTPQTPLEGKFSLRFVTAMTLLGRELSNEAFTHENIHDPTVRDWLGRITVQLSERIEETGSLVTLHAKNGTTASKHTREGEPQTDKKMEWSNLVRKFHGLCAPILGEYATLQLVDAIAAVEDAEAITDIAELCALPRRNWTGSI